MWYGYNREEHIDRLKDGFDVLVIGGGITGAGVFKEALSLGYSCCLVEKMDFASGTSSWSSKMVHGGLRYLKEGDVKLTFESVKERELILAQARYLVEPLTYLMPIYRDKRFFKYILPFFLKIYDLFSIIGNKGKKRPWFRTRGVGIDYILSKVPNINQRELVGGVEFEDSLTDDSRLVMAVLREGLSDGGVLLNYMELVGLLRDRKGKVVGGIVEDKVLKNRYEIKAKVVISCAGVWSKSICDMFGINLMLRPLRGSHIILSSQKLPVPCCITAFHPRDNRPLFAFPWEGATVVGTTDLDHREELSIIPKIEAQELEYLLEWVNFVFSDKKIDKDDIISTYAGVRPIVSSGKKLPSKEPRRHFIIKRDHIVLVVGGKLTTFRKIAQDALSCAKEFLPRPRQRESLDKIFQNIPWHPDVNMPDRLLLKLLGRYGIDSPNFFMELDTNEYSPLYKDRILGEIRWCSRHEAVVHLDDLLLRRTRVGLILPNGGEKIMDFIKPIIIEELGWDDKKWNKEVDRYFSIWRNNYYLPQGN